MEFSNDSKRRAGGVGAGLVTILVLMLTAGYVLFLYPGAISKFGNGIALLRPHH
jgi:hypothetical protein